MHASFDRNFNLHTYDSFVFLLLIFHHTTHAQLVLIDDELIWDRKKEGRFPEISEMKRKVRDIVALERNLGHNEAVDGDDDGNKNSEDEENLDSSDDDFDDMEDGEAAELRGFYGVL